MSRLDKQTVFKIIKENSSSIEALGVITLGLFGSTLTNTNQENSDVDLLVDFSPHYYNFNNFIQLAELLESILGKKIDLLTKNSLSKHIGPYILKQVEYVDFRN